MTIADLAITSLETITAFKASGGDYLFTLDELQNATISQSQESTDITGKKGRKLSTLKRNKTFSVSASNGLVSTGLLAAQTGGTFGSGSANINWSEELAVTSAEATLSYSAVGTAGSEIKHLFIKDSQGLLGKELEQNAEAAEGKFAYDPTTKKLTFDGDEFDEDGNGEIFVIYERTITAEQLIVDDEVADVKAELFIDAIAEDKCANQFRVQIHVPKADISAEFSLDMGDNQAVHSFEAQALAGKCGANGNLWEWTVFGANAEDYASGITDTTDNP